MTKKYAVHPGTVFSKEDGDRHFIGFDQLVRLYGVKRFECFVWDKQTCRNPDRYVHLYPRHNGDYTIRRVMR